MRRVLLRRDGWKNQELAEFFGVHPATIRQVLSGKRWAAATKDLGVVHDPTRKAAGRVRQSGRSLSPKRRISATSSRCGYECVIITSTARKVII
jgi:hypothetical protein